MAVGLLRGSGSKQLVVLQHHHHGVSTSPHPFLCSYLEEGSDGLCSGEGGLEVPKPHGELWAVKAGGGPSRRGNELSPVLCSQLSPADAQ